MNPLKNFIALAVSILLSISVLADVPKLINYQGLLTNTAGVPVANATYTVTFTIYDAPTGGTNFWTEDQSVTTSDGLFTVHLGAVNTLSDAVFSSSTRYLGIKVSPNAEFSPRDRIVSTGYSYRVGSVDGASGGTIASKVTIGSTNINTGTDAFVAGANNRARGAYSVVSGGGGTQFGASDSNSALGDNSVVGGGGRNAASGLFATVGGGYNNAASGQSATVGGGEKDTASGGGATVGGGFQNVSSEFVATVGGGINNTASGSDATVGGGNNNTASGSGATVGGGEGNTASGFIATVGGGGGNAAFNSYATVGGGVNNVASGFQSVVGGGSFNSASSQSATVPGGAFNVASGINSFAAGNGAQALHDGTFVWSHGNLFSSTGIKQFLINAPGGVGIGTTSPTSPLEVAGTIHSNLGGFKFPDGTIQTSASGSSNFGIGNLNPGTQAFVAGANNRARGDYSVVSGGGGLIAADSNAANGGWSSVSGGRSNSAGGDNATVGGGQGNNASGPNTAVGGGESNNATNAYATVGGGQGNNASGEGATVGGGQVNSAADFYATVGGGQGNNALGAITTVPGGYNNSAFGPVSFVAGSNNRARGAYSVVSGGGGPNDFDSNSANGNWSVVSGGRSNSAGGDNATVGGGQSNTASGIYSTVPGGIENVASASASSAAGARAKALHSGTFVWSEGTVFSSTGVNQFLINAPGGVGIGTNSPTSAAGGQVGHINNSSGTSVLRLGNGALNGKQWEIQSSVIGTVGALNFSNLTDFNNPLTILGNNNVGMGQTAPAHPLHMASGAHVTAGGVWTNISSRELKFDIEPLKNDEYSDILNKLEDLEVVHFKYKSEPEVAHIGMIAEDAPDEMASPDRKGIPTADAIAFLVAAVKAQQDEIEKLEKRLKEVEKK